MARRDDASGSPGRPPRSDTPPADRAPGDEDPWLFAAAPVGQLCLRPDGTVVRVNRSFLADTGHGREDLVGRVVFPDLLGVGGRIYWETHVRPMLELHGSVRAIALDVVCADGTRLPVLLNAALDRTPDGVESQIRVVVLDVTDRRTYERELLRAKQRAEQAEADLGLRARELADALAAKDAAVRRVAGLADVALSLTSADSVADLERVVVGRGLALADADGGAVVSTTDDGWAVTVGAGRGARLPAVHRRLDHDSPAPAAWAARTGRRLLLPTRAALTAFDPAMAAAADATGWASWAFLPLTVQGATLGALVVGWRTEHLVSSDELELLDGLAAQCAQALLRMRITAVRRADAEEMQQLAEALQQALLTPPPPPDDLRIEVRYRPAAHHAQVGGDWYDAFRQPDGATMLTVGDVVGHDAVAAASMGQLRTIIRTLAYDAGDSSVPDSPAAVLVRAERAARGLAVGTLATTVLARIERDPAAPPGADRRLRWTNAGHLPPVLRRPDGSVVLLERAADLMLGVATDATAVPRHDHVTALPCGATLLLYTDGLVERRGASLDDGLTALTDAVRDLGDVPTAALCDGVLARLATRPGAGEDDVALVAVRVEDATPAPGAPV